MAAFFRVLLKSDLPSRDHYCFLCKDSNKSFTVNEVETNRRRRIGGREERIKGKSGEQ